MACDVNIAYQVIGDGPLDLVFVMGWVSHLEYFWREPTFARFLLRLASFARLILFDKRGTGLSDRFSDYVGRVTVKYGSLIEVTERFRLDKDSLAVRRNEIDATVGSRLGLSYVQIRIFAPGADPRELPP